MNVPNSSLNACNDSFVAADSDRIKASTQYFDDTGLMAILCRHDRPLFLANMWTAGEKRFYALAHIPAVFGHVRTNPSMVTNLESLRRNKWLNLQLSLRVLKDQIVSKLRARKFELANLDRAYRSRMLGGQSCFSTKSVLLIIP
jgi:hypothetical protein